MPPSVPPAPVVRIGGPYAAWHALHPAFLDMTWCGRVVTPRAARRHGYATCGACAERERRTRPPAGPPR